MNKDSSICLYEYNSETYCFRRLIEELYNIDCLENIHMLREDLSPTEEYLTSPWPFNEGSGNFEKTFYKKLNEPWVEFVSLYENFVYEYLPAIVGEEFIFQKTPNFRIHIPNQKAVNKWHFDADQDHKHPVGEINFIIPITEMRDTNSVWVESSHGLADYAPINFDKSQFCKFNGNMCAHGNKINVTNKSRISFDFRILPMSCYPPKGLDSNDSGKSLWMNTKYDIGGYYKKMEK